LYFYDWVVYSDLLYCEGDFKTVTVQVSNSSTTSNSNEFSIRIWPNPATDILYINHTEPLDYIEVKNTSSQLTEIYNGSENHIDISNYPPGLYILSIYKNESEKHFKFIKL
ncbi:MAG TPA: T9SS type A sorting domain-containing protein, partial [Saprospiraceae bacterium]|nr:T9SS type A sorting domain-containing protein [Saprospiraceae bacterium]